MTTVLKNKTKIEVFLNPSFYEFSKFRSWVSHGAARALISKSNVYCWDAFEASYGDVIKYFKIGEEGLIRIELHPEDISIVSTGFNSREYAEEVIRENSYLKKIYVGIINII